MSWPTLDDNPQKHYVSGEGYVVLLGRYPLLPIQDEVDYERATTVLSDLFGRDDLDAEAQGYLDTLIDLIQKYERREHAINTAMSPVEVLRHLMEANGLNISDIGRIIGSQSTASDFLNGKLKSLSVARARKLSNHFRLEIGAFLGTQVT